MKDAVSVFCAYAHEDAAYMAAFASHMRALEREGLVTLHYDHHLVPGRIWDEELSGMLRSAGVIVLLVSPHFMESDYCYDIEMATALQRHALGNVDVVPVIIRPVRWQAAPFAHLQALPPDSRSSVKPVATWRNRDAAWLSVVEGIRSVVARRPARSGGADTGSLGIVPRPPTPFLPYRYAASAVFVGRREELADLSRWSRDANHPVYVIDAIGGMGKSALAWQWMRITAAEPGEYDGVTWWSFYDRESTFERFVRMEAEYICGRPSTRIGIQDTWDQVVAGLNTGRFLIVLDGLERLMRSYASTSADYSQDYAIDESIDACRVASATASKCLTDLLQLTGRSKVLVTTRLVPTEFQPHSGKTLSGWIHRPLGGVREDDALRFCRDRGVRGHSSEIVRQCRRFGFHPLTLELFAGALVDDPVSGGEIAKADELLEEVSDVREGMARVLSKASARLQRPETELLRRLAAFRADFGAEDLETVARLTIDAVAPEAEFRPTFRRLYRLLLSQGFIQNHGGRLDMHPIVRSHFYEQLGEDQAPTHASLAKYFAEHAPRTEVRDVSDLRPTIEWCHHLALAGQHDMAARVYQQRLNHDLHYRFGRYETAIEVLSPLFDRLPADYRLRDSTAVALLYFGYSLCRAGWMARFWATPFFARMRECVRTGDRLVKSDEATWLCLVANALFFSGSLDLSIRAYERIAELTEPSEFPIAFFDFARVCCYVGDDGRIGDLTRRLAGLFCGDPEYSEVVVDLRLRRAVLTEVGDDEVLDLVSLPPQSGRFDNLYVPRGAMLRARLLARVGRMDEADSELARAERHLAIAPTAEIEPEVLLARGEWLNARGDMVRSRQEASRALASAERSGFRLLSAECHAWLGGALGHADHARAALEYSCDADGGRLRYTKCHRRAEGLVALLGSD